MVSDARILIVEDNEDLAFGLQTNLEVQGYHVELAVDGRAGLARAQGEAFDLIVLDLMLPNMGGIDVLKQIRNGNQDIPILILTARGNEVDKVMGLRLGADDYVTKPFGLMELMARVEALLRRARSQQSRRHDTYRFGAIQVETEAQRVTCNGEPVVLTPKEYGLLLALIERDGAVASRIELMKEIWGHSSVVASRTVDTHIAELRRKLEDDPSRPKFIVTVHKSGYRMDK